MTILVTGGAGYIGSHTCVALVEAGYDLVVVDSFANSRPEALGRVQQITGREFPVYPVDLLDERGLDAVFEAQPVEAVIHFAALKAVGESVADPLRYYRNNVGGSISLFQTMERHGVTRLVFSSSATVYGAAEQMPLTEESPLGPVNPYGRTKWMVEQILRDQCAARPDWSVALLRYFNPVGAHASGRIGEDPSGVPNNLLPYVTQVAVGRLEQLTIHGDDYPTPDGTCIRDYVHVMDIAEGHVNALQHVLMTTGIEAFNLGTGRGSSVLEVVAAFEAATGIDIPRRVGPRRNGDAPVSYAGVDKAKQQLGWQAKRDLTEMCADAWRWQRENPQGYGV
ncbi:MAG: UDP-glucose 4-epimerase GalE [Alicyclobacillus sp.]|nr:UDP-glucose 4-epimerase GalE [Alicyclobacillus sp.]